jgi:hypothetical protein
MTLYQMKKGLLVSVRAIQTNAKKVQYLLIISWTDVNLTALLSTGGVIFLYCLLLSSASVSDRCWSLWPGASCDAEGKQAHDCGQPRWCMWQQEMQTAVANNCCTCRKVCVRNVLVRSQSNLWYYSSRNVHVCVLETNRTWTKNTQFFAMENADVQRAFMTADLLVSSTFQNEWCKVKMLIRLSNLDFWTWKKSKGTLGFPTSPQTSLTNSEIEVESRVDSFDHLETWKLGSKLRCMETVEVHQQLTAVIVPFVAVPSESYR